MRMAAAVLASIMLGLTGAAASPTVPAVTAQVARWQDAAVVTLAGATGVAGAPEIDDAAIVVRVPGVLKASERVPSPLPRIRDVVVAQHDPTTIWVVAHLNDRVGVTTTTATDGVRIVFGAADAPPPSLGPLWRTAVAPKSRFSVTWRDMPIRTGLALVAQLAHTPVTVDPRIAGTVTLTIAQASLPMLLQAIASHARAEVHPDPRGGYLVTPVQ